MKKINHMILGCISILIILSAGITYLLIASWWNQQYNQESFNCVDMSHTVKIVLNHIMPWLPVQQVWGRDKTQPEGSYYYAHSWLRLAGFDFDATNLMFSSNSQRWSTIDYVQ